MSRSRLSSINDAIEGIIYAVKNQKNIRIHFYVAAFVLFLSAFLGITRTEFMIVTIVIGLVLICELINSAVEGSVDLIADHYHPLAKVIKDVAAGAVLVSAIVAVVCGFLIFYDHITDPLTYGISLVKRAPPYITLVALIFIVIIVVATKARHGKGTPLAGGMPSGHAAVSFGIFTAVAMSTDNVLIIILTLMLAAMVSHSRLIYNIHNLREVVVGALLGSLATLFMFQLFS